MLRPRAEPPAERYWASCGNLRRRTCHDERREGGGSAFFGLAGVIPDLSNHSRRAARLPDSAVVRPRIAWTSSDTVSHSMAPMDTLTLTVRRRPGPWPGVSAPSPFRVFGVWSRVLAQGGRGAAQLRRGVRNALVSHANQGPARPPRTAVQIGASHRERQGGWPPRKNKHHTSPALGRAAAVAQDSNRPHREKKHGADTAVFVGTLESAATSLGFGLQQRVAQTSKNCAACSHCLIPSHHVSFLLPSTGFLLTMPDSQRAEDSGAAASDLLLTWRPSGAFWGERSPTSSWDVPDMVVASTGSQQEQGGLTRSSEACNEETSQRTTNQHPGPAEEAGISTATANARRGRPCTIPCGICGWVTGEWSAVDGRGSGGVQRRAKGCSWASNPGLPAGLFMVDVAGFLAKFSMSCASGGLCAGKPNGAGPRWMAFPPNFRSL
ncbi:hypothetical protein QBC47DRAFT_82620 [Echria macrotheca]|uniref:Uncharacterized protein n=1 Tax=Echria macrotheca TaxID=438768 RepID=A0AAJ0B4I4_9PEZI|nr:hypothetical protein QBC47DRAFT_82620 [Echria macrotheca]